MLQQLKDRYQQYDAQANEVRKNAAPLDGLFGFGRDPKKHPCHREFYEDVGKWVQDFLASSPDAQQSLEAARFLIDAPTQCASRESYWMMYAAQGWCRELVSRLEPSGCAQLRDLLDQRHPPIDRMPAQRELYQALKKGAKKG